MAEFKIPELKQGKGKANQFERGAEHHSTAETVRITVDLNADLHRRLKVRAAMEGVRMADLVRRWMEEHTSDTTSV